MLFEKRRVGQEMKFVFKIVLLLCATLVLSSCDGGFKSVAATVDGVAIDEGEVTARIMAKRTQNPAHEDDAKWAAYLKQAGMTPELMRVQVVNEIAMELVVLEAARTEGLAVDAAAIDGKLAQMRGAREEEAWLSMLQNYGYTSEAAYRSSLERQELHSKLRDLKTATYTMSEEDLQAYVLSRVMQYSGRKSSHILLRQEEGQSEEELNAQAAQLVSQLRGGADFTALAAQHSKDYGSSDKGGDMGWSSRYALPLSYVEALNALSVGGISDPVKTEYGVHIIKCTNVFTPEGVVTDYSSIPADIAGELRVDAVKSLQDSAYQQYVNTLMADVKIDIRPIPGNLPYRVNMRLAE
jgi:foldase protein PrsA